MRLAEQIKTSGLMRPGVNVVPALLVLVALLAFKGVAETQSATVSLGKPKTLFNWDTDHCVTFDLPDAMAQAIRNYKGEIVLQASNPSPQLYFFFGNNFKSLKKDCNPVMTAGDNHQDPSAFKPSQWIGPMYTEDGKTIHALVHNEFNGTPETAPSYCFQNGVWCYYDSLTYAVSNDGGHTFTQPTSPNHLIASFPKKQDFTKYYNVTAPGVFPHVGYHVPMGIVKGKDGYYYAMVMSTQSYDSSAAAYDLDSGHCLMRTQDLSDPKSWRFWRNGKFKFKAPNPYVEGESGKFCDFVDPESLRGATGRLVYSAYFEKYMLVGLDLRNDANGNLDCGVFYWLSDDLLEWSEPQKIMNTRFGFNDCGYGPEVPIVAYVSIIDHKDKSLSFENVGKKAYLYYSTFGAEGGWVFDPVLGAYLDQDLVRRRIKFKKQ